MFKSTKLFLAAALSAVAMLPSALGAQSLTLQHHPELQDLLTKKTTLAQEKKLQADAPGAMLNLPAIKKPGSANAMPFAAAKKHFSGVKAPMAPKSVAGALASKPVNMLGYVSYSETYNTGYMYGIQMPSGSFDPIAELEYAPTRGGAYIDGVYNTVFVDDTYGSWGFYFFYTLQYDPETFELLGGQSVDDGGYGWYCRTLTTTPDGTMGFGQFYNTEGNGLQLCTVDFATATKTVVADVEDIYITMAAGKDVVYGFGYDNCLYAIDPATGASTKVGDTGLVYCDEEGAYYQSASYDAESNTIYWAYASADGTTTGIYTVDPATGAATPAVDLGLTYITGLVVVPAAAADDAPAAVTDLAASFEGASLAGQISFTAPAVSFAGGELIGDLTYTVLANSVQVATGTVAAGAAATADVTLNDGVNNVVVTVANAAGESPKAKLTVVAGYDVPAAPQNVALAISAEGVVELTWDAVTTALNKGYVGTITYNVYEVVGENFELRGTAETNAFTETIEVGSLTNHIYAVEAVNGDKVSAKAQSNGVVVGSAVDVPCAFDLATDFSLMTVLDANNDGKTWESTDKYARYRYSSSNQADDYLFSPNIKLQGGKNYILTYQAMSYSTSFPERLEILVGQGTTAEAQTQTVVAPYIVPKDEVDSEVKFQVSADGEYNIAFHAISDADMFYLLLTHFSIEKDTDPLAPDSVKSLKAVAGAEGALQATISFNAPTKTVGGQDLTSITKIDVLRGNEVVKSFEAPAPGAALSFVDDAVAAGVNEWTVIPYNEYENGTKAVVSVFIGVDVPAAPDATLTDLGTQVRIDWAPVTVGANGGYVSDLQYEIYGITESGYVGDLIATVSECTYTIDFNTNEGDADLLQYAMRTVGAGGNSSYVGTSGLLIGAPAPLPMIEEFVGGDLANFMWLSDSSDDMGLSLSTENNGSALFTANAAGASVSLNTAKLTLAGAQKPMTILEYTADAPYSVLVYAVGIDSKTQIGSFDVAAGEVGAKMFAVPATDAWFYIAVEATAGDAGKLYLGTYSVRDVLDYNLSVDLKAPASVEKGAAIKVVATVTNEGANTATGAMLKVTAGEEVQTIEIDELAPFDVFETEVEFETSIFSEEESVDVFAQIEYANDLKPEDNEASVSVALTESAATGVQNLEAVGNEDGSVTLTWDLIDAAYGEVVEDWESYEGFSAFPVTACDDSGNLPAEIAEVGTLGDWTAYDLDKKGVYGWSSSAIAWPYTGYAMGFCTYDANELFSALEDPLATVHGGTKALLCMDNNVKNDDWLISPVLPGVAQTVSFWVNEITSQYGPEVFEVYYSTTDKEVASFIKVGDGEANADNGWQQVSYNLPEGALYFAIRVVSADVFGLYIDDITYTAGVAAPIRYDVYRDYEMIGATNDNIYVDAIVPAGPHTYSVISIYENGKQSAPVSVQFENAVSINAIATEAQSINAYNVGGVRMNVKTTDELQHGVYMVNGKKVVK